MTVIFRSIQCFAFATVLDTDGKVVASLTCQLPGGRPCYRTVPYHRDVRDVVEGAPICHTAEQFETWVNETYIGDQ